MRRHEKAIILAFLAWLSLGSWADAADTGNIAKKRVLAILFSDENLPFTSELVQGLRRSLISKSPYPVELNIEYADLVRYTDHVYLRKFINLLQYKYS
ncbi:MAG: hypothetical protein WAO07_09370, partial [Desulfobacterales bacterium]